MTSREVPTAAANSACDRCTMASCRPTQAMFQTALSSPTENRGRGYHARSGSIVLRVKPPPIVARHWILGRLFETYQRPSSRSDCPSQQWLELDNPDHLKDLSGYEHTIVRAQLDRAFFRVRRAPN